MDKIAFLTPFICFLTVTMSCNDGGQPVVPTPSATNLLSNPSFESNGHPSSSGWVGFGNPMAAFSTDVPPGGGIYSASIASTWPAGGVRLQASIAAREGSNIYRFGMWAKYSGLVRGETHLSVQRAGVITLSKSIIVTDTVWTEYSAFDTLNTIAGDTLLLRLFGGGDPVAGGDSYFDNCRVERLN
jgi:hypothetical protein